MNKPMTTTIEEQNDRATKIFYRVFNLDIFPKLNTNYEGYLELKKQALVEITDELSQVEQSSYEQGRLEERKRLAEEYGDYRYIGQKKGFGRYEIGRTLRFHLLPHTKHKKGDDENI